MQDAGDHGGGRAVTGDRAARAPGAEDERPGRQTGRSGRLQGSAAALVAASAFAGTAGLVTGALALTDPTASRLPFASPVAGGVALAVVVGVPFSVSSWRSFRGDRRAPATSLAAGALLIGWIAVELAVIREFSFLQPFYAAVGAGFVGLGLHGMRHPAGREARP